MAWAMLTLHPVVPLKLPTRKQQRALCPQQHRPSLAEHQTVNCRTQPTQPLAYVVPAHTRFTSVV
jgi:hypothetical protein